VCAESDEELASVPTGWPLSLFLLKVTTTQMAAMVRVVANAAPAIKKYKLGSKTPDLELSDRELSFTALKSVTP